MTLQNKSLVGVLLTSIAIAAGAQTTDAASGPNGTSPGSAPSPAATAVGPGASSGTRVTESTAPSRTYEDASPGDGNRLRTSAPPVAPESTASSPGTTIRPVDQALRRQAMPPQSQLAPLPKESAISAPGVAPGTPRLTVAPTRQRQDAVVTPDDQHAPAVDNTVPTTPTPIRSP